MTLQSVFSASTNSQGKGVLICDDDPSVTLVLKEGLTRAGFEVDAFNDPRFAFSVFKENRYSLVILDEIMPQIDGIALYQLMKRVNPQVRVIFVTGYGTAVRRALPELGDKSVFEKPVDMGQLVTAMREAIGAGAGTN